MAEQLNHGRNCGWYTVGGDGVCTCALAERIALQTEQTMSAAWRKRAEQAERELAEFKASR